MPQIVAIERVSLHPDSDFDQRASPARKALTGSLQAIADNPKCLRVLWMKKETTSVEIVVISKWKEKVDQAESTAQTASFQSHVSHETIPTICMEDTLENITCYSDCSLFIFYFPASIMTEDLKCRVQTQANEFISTTSPGQQMNPKSLTSAWSTETIHINDQDMYTFLLCTTWHDPESQEQFHLANTSWKSFLADIQTLGSTSKDNCHGKLHQVYRRHAKYVFPDSDNSEEEEEILDLDIELFNLSAAAARLKLLAEGVGREVGTGHRGIDNIGGRVSLPEDTIVIERGRLRRIE